MNWLLLLFALLLVSIGNLTAGQLDCGYPGIPIGGETNEATDGANDMIYSPGTEVTYRCKEESDTITGKKTRVCQPDGRWSGRRPWCERNLARGAKVTFNGAEGHRTGYTDYGDLLTDGIVDPEDQECPLMMPSAQNNSYFQVELADSYAVNCVFLHLNSAHKYLRNDRVYLVGSGDPVECRRHTVSANSTSKHVVMYKCQDRNDGVNLNSKEGTAVRFEHYNNHSLAICEIEVYTNPIVFECGMPEVPVNGQVDINKRANYEEATYTCYSGYKLKGSGKRVCYGRHWQGEQALCVEDTVIVANLDKEVVASNVTTGEEDYIDLSPEWERTAEEEPVEGSTDDELKQRQWLVVGVISIIFLAVVLGVVLMYYWKMRRHLLANQAQKGFTYVKLSDDSHDPANVTVPADSVYFDGRADAQPDNYMARQVKRIYQVIRDV